ncbi:MAG: HlyD family efflux transporter periplasmic adaptor subunit [Acidobacteria bacterium]|nr:MAG: HlyD family efflux transporter periplasmic adaptor subunit [Acidobacteriota bacterium]
MTNTSRPDAPKRRITAARIVRLVGLLLVVVAVIAGFTYREDLRGRVTKAFVPADEDPVPVARLTKEPFRLTVPAIGEIVGLGSTPVPTPNTRSGSLKVGWLIPEGTFVKEGDTLIRYDSTDARLNLERQQNTLDANQERSKLTTGKQSTDEKVLGLDRQDAEMQYDYVMEVLPEDETIFSKWDIIEAKIDAGFAKERVTFLNSKGKTQKRIARSDQQILAIERNQAQAEMSVAEQTLNSLELKAPSAGLVLWRRDHRRDPQVGDESFGGQVLVEIVDLAVLQARVYVLERDGGHLAKGQEVVIRLDAVPEREFHGEIRSASTMAAALERNSPLKYFTCDVHIADAGVDLKRIRPGMSLKGEVILEKYDKCYVVPASAVTTKDKNDLVYVQQGDDFKAQVVQTGLSTHGQAVILSGVEDGAVIALRNPFETRKLTLPDFSKASAGDRRRGGGGPGGPGMMIRIEGGRR